MLPPNSAFDVEEKIFLCGYFRTSGTVASRALMRRTTTGHVTRIHHRGRDHRIPWNAARHSGLLASLALAGYGLSFILEGGFMSTRHPVSYLFDPLCGWCYGAAPMIARLRAEADIDLTSVPSGLFAEDGAFPASEAFAAHAWSADQRIAAMTGQVFSDAYRRDVLGNQAAHIDSGPATLALAAVRRTEPDREWEALKAIQAARYVDGLDNGDAATVGRILADAGFGAAVLRYRDPDAALLSAYRAIIDEGRSLMRRFAIRGVPALILGQGDSARPLGADYLFGGVGRLLDVIRSV